MKTLYILVSLSRHIYNSHERVHWTVLAQQHPPGHVMRGQLCCCSAAWSLEVILIGWGSTTARLQKLHTVIRASCYSLQQLLHIIILNGTISIFIFWATDTFIHFASKITSKYKYQTPTHEFSQSPSKQLVLNINNSQAFSFFSDMGLIFC